MSDETRSAPVRPPPGRFWRNYGLATLAALLGWAVAAQYVGFATYGPLLTYILIATPLLTWVAVASARTTLGGAAAAFLAIGTIIAILFLGTPLIAAAMKLVPPPRPMFSNHFGEKETTLMPIWWRPMPLSDAAGRWAWTDHEDNVIVLVVTGDRGGGRFAAIRAGMNETRFKTGPDEGERFVVVQRCRDRLIVLQPDGTRVDFDLPDGAARAAYPRMLDIEGDLVAAIRSLLHENQRPGFDAALPATAPPTP